MNRNIKRLTLIALFPALMGATSGISIPLFGGLAPITLQTMFVVLAGLLLSPKDAVISMVVYLLMGAIGIPVFSGYSSGLGVLLGATGGFLFGFIFLAFFISIMKNVKFLNNEYYQNLIVISIGTIILYLIGGVYLSLYIDTKLFPLLLGFVVYIPGDIVKSVVATVLYARVNSVVTYEYR